MSMAIQERAVVATGDAATTTEPPWLLRINPLRRRRISDAGLRTLLTDLVTAEQAVQAAAARACDELYALIGAVAEDGRKPLVDARRAINKGRLPRTDVAGAPSIAGFAAALARRDTLGERYLAEYPKAADRERTTLAGLLGDADLRRSLALLAPEVYEQAERYRAAVAGPSPVLARMRKSERGLIQYVTRAMVRTSPLSRFTAVGIAIPDDSGRSPLDVPFTGATAFPSLDRVMLAYVIGGIDPPDGGERLLDAWVGMSPTSRVVYESGTLFFFRPGPDGLKRSAVAVRGTTALLAEAVSMGPSPVRFVIEHIARGGVPAGQAARVVADAVASGILCTYNEAEDGGADLMEQLTRPGTIAADGVAAVRAGLTRLVDSPAAQRGADLATLTADLAAVSRLTNRPAQVTIEEDYILPPSAVDTRPWRPALADLGAAVELFSVFDWLHDIRRMTTAAFVERFGRGAVVSLTEHASYLLDEVSRRVAEAGAQEAGGDPDALPDDPELRRLIQVRRRIMELTRGDIARAVSGGEPEVHYHAADILDLAADLPQCFRRDPLSYGVLSQWAGDRLIFNDGLPGHGMLYSRFLDQDRRLGGYALPRLRRRLVERYGWDGATVVEDLGLHRLNVNAHPRVLDDVLRPQDWFGLRLRHDPDADALDVEDADGRRLRVLAIGTGHPGLFPPPLSIASCLATAGRLNNYLIDQWHAANPWDGTTTRVSPRISIGDVVVARRRWYGGEEFVRTLEQDADEHGRLLAVARWRAAHGVPDEVMVKTSPTYETPRSLRPEDAVVQRQNQKPQYVDLSSALAVRVLPRMLERRALADAVDYLEEALPGVADGTHAHEWVVEIGRRPGGRFRYEGGVQ
ncbi:hypothetical protein [Dactylosporangium sp. NPDC051484]|uniref:lantibiotic dehydratase n=1 Tax=Dactylosporangium sp. NPDC051484 TaxID=3154942 RepID=UPI00344CCD47